MYTLVRLSFIYIYVYICVCVCVDGQQLFKILLIKLNDFLSLFRTIFFFFIVIFTTRRLKEVEYMVGYYEQIYILYLFIYLFIFEQV